MTPDKHTITETTLDVEDGHTLYLHQWGNPDAATPILFLHGGPGGSSKDRHKQLFDPLQQQVIFFDQRGAGRSTPYGSIEHNTTQDLVDDIEKILQHLKVERVIITGGSWGSCLAFAFALAYPHRVHAMVLEGIFTGSTQEISWLDSGRFRTFFPDAWEQYAATAPHEHRENPSSYHFFRILGEDMEAAKESAHAYETLEGAVVKLDDRTMPDNFDEYDPAGIRIETHYMSNGCFMPDEHILKNAHVLQMPVYMVQGRYDMVCPPVTAYELSKVLPAAELIWTTSGHVAERESWNLIRTILRSLTKAVS